MPGTYDPRKLPVVVDTHGELDFFNSHKPSSRKRYWWPILFWVCAGVGVVYLTHGRHGAAEQLVELTGWDGLLPCSYVASFDGTKKLSFAENGRAVLYDKSAKGGSIDGNWTFDETAKLYTLSINGEIATYSVVEPGARASACWLRAMLALLIFALAGFRHPSTMNPAKIASPIRGCRALRFS